MKRMFKIIALLMAALMAVTSCQAPDSGSQLTSETVDVSFMGPSARTITTDDGLVQTVATSDLWFQYKAVWQGGGDIPSTATNGWTSLAGPGLTGTVKLHRGTWDLSLRAFVNQSDVGTEGKFILSGTVSGVTIGANNVVSQTVPISLGYVRQEGDGTLHVSATYPVVYREAANPQSNPVQAVRKIKVTANVSGTDYTGYITTFNDSNVGTLDLQVPAGAAHVTVQYYMDDSTLFEGDQASKDVLIMATMTTNLAVSVDRDITAVQFETTQPVSPESQYPVLNFNSVLDIYPDNLTDDTAVVVGYSSEETKSLSPTPITYPYTIISNVTPDENGRYNASALGLTPIVVANGSELNESGATEAWYGKSVNYSDFNNNNLVHVKIMDGSTSIDDCAFESCNELKSLLIPNTVESIGGWAFEYCDALESIVIPDSVTLLGECAFEDCTALKTVKIGNGVTVIDERTFNECGSLESVILGNNIEQINYEAFNRCHNLKNINLPESLTTIGDGAFYECGFTSITIPSAVTMIDDHAFECCRNLLSIAIPDSVTYLGEKAVGGCEKLVSAAIGKGANDIHYRAFKDSAALETITVSEDNTTYASIDGVLIDKVNSLLVQYPEGKTGEFPIPDSVTSIEESAFSGCTGLTSITIPESITTIDYQTFYGCTALTSVTIPEGVTSIGDAAFEYCSGLTTITIPSSVTSIGRYVFGGCSGLTNIYVAQAENNTLFANVSVPSGCRITWNSTGPEATGSV